MLYTTAFYFKMWTPTNHTRLLQAEPGQLPNMPCLYLNTTELGEPQEQRLTAYHLSSFSCYIKTLFQLRQLSEIFSHLPESLQKICQIVSDMEQLVPDPQAREDCSLPSLEDVELCVYVKCLLQHLDQRLSNARF